MGCLHICYNCRKVQEIDHRVLGGLQEPDELLIWVCMLLDPTWPWYLKTAPTFHYSIQSALQMLPSAPGSAKTNR